MIIVTCIIISDHIIITCIIISDYIIAVYIISDYSFEIQKGDAGDYSGTVSVRHYGLYGRICSAGWDDIDAMVLLYKIL